MQHKQQNRMILQTFILICCCYITYFTIPMLQNFIQHHSHKFRGVSNIDAFYKKRT